MYHSGLNSQSVERWVRDLVAQGWTAGSGEKDPLRKTHPDLVPREALTADSRQRDIDAVRFWPELLARVGLEARVETADR